ncbi:MAG TPA: nuclear transport factor 2 family protein [Acidimicrobiales bacterium]
MPATRDSIDATIDAYLAAFSAGDREGWLACFAEGAWIEDPVGSPRRTGRDEIVAFWDETHAMPDSIELRPLGLRIIVGGEAVFTMQARPVLGGATFAMDVIDHMTFDDGGRIVSLRAFFDPAAMRPAEGDQQPGPQ